MILMIVFKPAVVPSGELEALITQRKTLKIVYSSFDPIRLFAPFLDTQRQLLESEWTANGQNCDKERKHGEEAGLLKWEERFPIVIMTGIGRI